MKLQVHHNRTEDIEVLRYVVGWGFVSAGFALFLLALTLWATGAWREHRDREQFRDALRGDAVAAVSSQDENRDASSIGLGILRIDRLGFSVLVRAGSGSKELAQGAGWIPGTARPGERGNVGIAGHRDTFFRDLRKIHVGDRISLVTPRGERNYVVDTVDIAGPDAVDVLQPTKRSALTLVTCYPFYFVGSAPQRFIVRAFGG
jgi:LPXTG-site transpeptidase (sortase) family protein